MTAIESDFRVGPILILSIALIRALSFDPKKNRENCHKPL
jgi:hypothetical protein